MSTSLCITLYKIITCEISSSMPDTDGCSYTRLMSECLCVCVLTLQHMYRSYCTLAYSRTGELLRSYYAHALLYRLHQWTNSVYSETSLIRHSMGLEKVHVRLGGCRSVEYTSFGSIFFKYRTIPHEMVRSERMSD